ncbi:futalosine hydrolase [Pedobacter sandarakinus]|uniref:futalosine hydrolase n=1 Tax=Pedobacter sandarakinus TaxID=353156 RepID=UPI002245934E|nr:futalosine hydrolase [Pedobacter sandarakinus]MCX2573576.1 futalosine hydrolase [Pedobacter sandarakinus]
MKTLIVAATKAELAYFYQHYHLAEDDFIVDKNFDVVISGVGMVATAYALGKHLSGKYHLVINVGIGGTFDKSIALGTLLNITQDTFAELGAQNGDTFLSIAELGFGEEVYHSNNSIAINLPTATAITVNCVSGKESHIKALITRLNPQVESMEGAAVFYACKKENIPCLQVRGISNYVEPRNKANWEIGLAIKNLNNWLISFISEMN